MKTPVNYVPYLAALVTFVFAAFAPAALPAETLSLPAPQKTGGMPLMEALSKRSTARNFDAARELSPQQLSNLLWAAFGINREDGRRTAPSAKNLQEVDIYVLLSQGAYLYDAKANALVRVAEGDRREVAGTQAFAQKVPLTLMFVADSTRMGSAGDTPANREMAAIDTGFIAQNAYLFCASEGLVACARLSVDRAKLAKELSLKPTQWFELALSVGYAQAK